MDRGNASGTTVLIPGVFTTDNTLTNKTQTFRMMLTRSKIKL